MANYAVSERSRLLSDAENDVLHSLLGRGCCALAVAVVRLYIVKDVHQWIYKCCGVACFVRDKMERAYFIRVYDIINKMELSEQELYLEITYTRPLAQFHIMQSDVGPMGISFASAEEARMFGDLVIQRIEKRAASNRNVHPPNVPSVAVTPQSQMHYVQPGISEPNRPVTPAYQRVSGKRKKSKGKKLLSVFRSDTQTVSMNGYYAGHSSQTTMSQCTLLLSAGILHIVPHFCLSAFCPVI
ncbi:hypothetical protein EG68_08647 [Paragonimus skrjabini miyazakii]|uniref:WH1 domain-containing protein n=1 Tax=Paragonimus skrjabini miyazakii TaxID=59628 RepID=A0A8S9YKC7_9TREM|nr:hypothetical protein EG68_08647 [Paragonimus skrjabini miyazakii]